ncbi:MAG: hypothetical protein ACHP79_13580, partial [Terriglobales bacterium]
MPFPATPRVSPGRAFKKASYLRALTLLLLVFAALPARADGVKVRNILMVVPRTMQRTAMN